MTGLLLFPPPWSLPPWWSGSLTVTVWVHSILGQGREDSSWRFLEISNLIGSLFSILNKSSPADLRTPAYPVPGLAPWLRSIESRSGTRYTIPRLASHSPPIVVTAHDPASGLLQTDQLLNMQITKIQICQVWWLQLGLLLSLVSCSFSLLLSIPHNHPGPTKISI